MGRIRGQEDAKLIVRSVRRGQAGENELHEALQQQLATGDADRVRGFMCALQKAIGGPAQPGVTVDGAAKASVLKSRGH